jgi:hypothetical protein
MPGGAVLLCPWVDLTCALQRQPSGEPQPATIVEQLRRFAYLDGHPIDDPLVSPLPPTSPACRRCSSTRPPATPPSPRPAS